MKRDNWLKELNITEDDENILSKNEFERTWQEFSSIIIHNLGYCQFLVEKLVEKGIENKDMDNEYNAMLASLESLADTLKAEYEK